MLVLVLEDVDGVDVLQQVLQDGVVLLLAQVEQRHAPEDEDADHQGRGSHQGEDGQVEGHRMIFESGSEVHPEDGGEASSEGESEHAHLDEEAHPYDAISGTG